MKNTQDQQNQILNQIKEYLISQPYEVLQKLWASLESSGKENLIELILQEYQKVPVETLIEQHQHYLNRDSCYVFRGF